jgi:hypothetical protein
VNFFLKYYTQFLETINRLPFYLKTGATKYFNSIPLVLGY